MTTMEDLAGQLESVPGYDYAMDKWNEFAGDKFKTKDPYLEELPNGKTRKLKLPSNSTNQERKTWKKIQKKAWTHDKCFMGCYPVDCGIGLGPLLILIPGIGPILMFAIHSRLITLADKNFDIDASTTAKCNANILFDFLISLPPVLGSLFAWMNGCSTRNAALIHTRICKNLAKRHERENRAHVQMNTHNNNNNNKNKTTSNNRQQQNQRQNTKYIPPQQQSSQANNSISNDPFKSPPQSPDVNTKINNSDMPRSIEGSAYYGRDGLSVNNKQTYDYANANTYTSRKVPPLPDFSRQPLQHQQQEQRRMPPPSLPARESSYQDQSQSQTRTKYPVPPLPPQQEPSLPPRTYQSDFEVQ